MKKIFLITIIAFLFVFVLTVNSQIVVIEKTISTMNGVHINNAITTTSDALPVIEATGSKPDSMYLQWNAHDLGDTNINVAVAWRTKLFANSSSTHDWSSWTQLDTVEADGTNKIVLARGTWDYSGAIQIRAVGIATGNSATASRSTLWLRLTKYFHK